ncbi:uncharacterized protein BT62DRAFT_1070982 [Guyanagaster necrorhizus]|uniref:Uncharacterized protein n=1 Tax=Guyanagaster necrorhizus TaxID=856835 RepID=A0A9P7W338_9AGAR|nr:uncharacterized protein BT62DRAFT_1070982 [Guyanagaster necrorhizus MCA 3950]KAG7451757.1 hypothetical protein BT62DRAFT_1070982 [Guyanagaster necrorhizus MCA 3950]
MLKRKQTELNNLRSELDTNLQVTGSSVFTALRIIYVFSYRAASYDDVQAIREHCSVSSIMREHFCDQWGTAIEGCLLLCQYGQVPVSLPLTLPYVNVHSISVVTVLTKVVIVVVVFFVFARNFDLGAHLKNVCWFVDRRASIGGFARLLVVGEIPRLDEVSKAISAKREQGDIG